MDLAARPADIKRVIALWPESWRHRIHARHRASPSSRDWVLLPWCGGSGFSPCWPFLHLLHATATTGLVWWDELGRGFVPVLVGAASHGWLALDALQRAPPRLHETDALGFVQTHRRRFPRGNVRERHRSGGVGLYNDPSGGRNSRTIELYRRLVSLLLLNWGHAVGVLQAMSSAFPAFTIITGVMLVIIARTRHFLALRDAVIIGICLLLLPLVGGGGAVFVPFMGLWLALSGIRCWRSAIPGTSEGKMEARSGLCHANVASGESTITGLDRRRFVLVMGLPAGAYAFLLICYLPMVGRQASSAAGPRAFLRGSLQFASQIFGPAAKFTWPLSGLGALVLLLAVVLVLLAVWYGQPHERNRVLGLLCFLSGFVLIAAIVGRNRTEAAYSLWYYDLAVPALCCAYLTGVLYYEATIGACSNGFSCYRYSRPCMAIMH